MIDWKNCQLIQYYHNKNNEIILKLLNKHTQEVFFAKERYEQYFFIDKKDLEKTQDILSDFVFTDTFSGNSTRVDFKFIEENDYIKIYYNNLSCVYLKGLIKAIADILDDNNIKHYEQDLMPGDNLILSNDIEIADTYRILFFDCETKDTTGGVEIGRDRILSICAVDNTGKEVVFCDDNEEKILRDFIKLLESYDCIVGWNSAGFDIPYIKTRLLRYEIYFSFKSFIHLDLMKLFRDSFAVKVRTGQKFLTSYSLNNVAKAFLNDAKIELDGEEGYGGRIFDLFENNRQKLIDYNLQDCKLMLQIDNEFNIIKNSIEIAKLAQIPLSKVSNVSSIIDFYVLRIARRKGLHFKSRQWNTEKATFPGGHVIEPTAGMYDNICIFDYRSLYPNIIRTFNISPDTILDDNFKGDCITTPNGVKFSKKRGIIPEILDTLTLLRYKYKEEQTMCENNNKKEDALNMEFKQTAVKVLILSFYGILGSAFSRLFNIKVAESITLTGQYLLKGIKKYLDTQGFPVIYGDTDSCMININNLEDIDKAKLLIKEFLDLEIPKFTKNPKHTLEMEHEKTFSKFIILAKKKYVGRCVWNGKDCDELYFMGIELKRGSELLITKQFLKEVLDAILFENYNAEQVLNIVLKYKKIIINREIANPDDITIIKKVGKMPNEYKNLPAHVSLAMKRKEKGERFYVSMRVPFIVLSKNPLKIIHKDDYCGEYDEKYYWTSQIFPPTYRLLNVVFIQTNWNKYKEGNMDLQNTLGDY